MARLDRPLYGDFATGTFARVLAFRHTANPPDAPGDPAIYRGTVAKRPASSCPASVGQAAQRSAYAAAVAAWRALSDDTQAQWLANHPTNLNGYNFFLRMTLLPNLVFFGFCIFGSSIFTLVDAPDQPAAAAYAAPFPADVDEFPALLNWQHSPQAWFLNRAYTALQTIQEFLINNRSHIES